METSLHMIIAMMLHLWQLWLPIFICNTIVIPILICNVVMVPIFIPISPHYHMPSLHPHMISSVKKLTINELPALIHYKHYIIINNLQKRAKRFRNDGIYLLFFPEEGKRNIWSISAGRNRKKAFILLYIDFARVPIFIRNC